MKLTSSVKVSNGFPQLRWRIHEGAIPRALNAAAKDGAEVARGIASERSRTGAMANVKMVPARRSTRGWDALIISPPFYAWFHEHGTLGNRRRKLKQPGRARRDRRPGTGIRPLRFLGRGRTAARRSLLDYLQREIRRVP
jgi:hypothetical protein